MQKNHEKEKTTNKMMIEGRNSVFEALSAGRPIDKIWISETVRPGGVKKLMDLAKERQVPVQFVKPQKINSVSQTEASQGVVAVCGAVAYAALEDLFRKAEEKKAPPFFIICDEITDPHNLGAIIRSANAAGADGVIIPKNRAVGLTATVARTSAGALNYLPVAKVTNLAKTIEDLKKEGLWFVCADMGGTVMYDLNLKGPIGLVIGSEGEGVGRLVKEKCDVIVSLPMNGNINSLNASVAAGVVMYEILRQRLK